MSIIRGPSGLRVFAAAAVLSAALTAALTVHAALPPPPDAEQIKLDAAIAGLKDEIVNFNRDALNVEDEVLYPAHSRTNIYFGVKVNALLMKSLSVAIDDQPPQVHTYSDAEARALINSKGLHRLTRIGLKPGAYRLRVDYVAQFADAKETDAPVSGHYEAIFDKRSRAAELELVLMRNTRYAQPEMRLRDRKVAQADETVPPPSKDRRRRIRPTLRSSQ